MSPRELGIANTIWQRCSEVAEVYAQNKAAGVVATIDRELSAKAGAPLARSGDVTKKELLSVLQAVAATPVNIELPEPPAPPTVQVIVDPKLLGIDKQRESEIDAEIREKAAAYDQIVANVDAPGLYEYDETTHALTFIAVNTRGGTE